MNLSLLVAFAVGLLSTLHCIGMPFWHRFEPLARRLLPVEIPVRAFAYGAVRRWLPCGLVYAMVIAGATRGVDLQALERDLIAQAISTSGGNRSRAARLLGITRDTLLYRIQKCAIDG
jgi:hypothetical protein